MADGRVEVEWVRAAKGHRPVHVVALLPIERHAPSVITRRRPSVGEPQQRISVASVHHELNPLTIGDRSVRKAIRLDEHAMARSLAVEGEVAALVSDRDEAPAKGQIARRAYRLRLEQKRPGQLVGGLQWVLRK